MQGTLSILWRGTYTGNRMIPVSPGHEGHILLWFSIQYIAGVAVLVYFRISGELTTPVAFDLLAPLVIVATANAIMVIEGKAMLAERFLKRRFAEGKAEGKAELAKEVAAWNRRRLEAQAKGDPFDEPPPTAD